MKLKQLSIVPLTAAASITALAGCAFIGGSTQAFCDVATDPGSRNAVYESVSIDPAAITAAQAGDMSALNQWGDDTVDALDPVLSDLNDAQRGAPDEEAEEAVTTILAVTTMLSDMAEEGRTATDVEEFFADLDVIAADFDENVAIDNDPDLILSAKAAEHCS